MISFINKALPPLLGMALAGCAVTSPEAQREALGPLLAGRTGNVQISPADLAPARTPSTDMVARIDALLAAPLTAEAAVRMAVLNNPGLQASLATLQLGEAERARVAQPPNPVLRFSRLVEGQGLEIDRALRFDVLGLLTLPWRLRWQERQLALVQVQAAQDVIRLAADTRKAWLRAVAAQQVADYTDIAREAAEAAAELARRRVRAGNDSRYSQAREQAQLADAVLQVTRARQAALREREQLARLLGLPDSRRLPLPPHLPELPATLSLDLTAAETMALRDRLDVRAAHDEVDNLADSMGLNRLSATLGETNFSVQRNTAFAGDGGPRHTQHGWELEIPVPIFDAGGARHARAQAQLLGATARAREVAVRARSEVREAWHAWHATHAVARQYQDHIVPLHKLIHEETVLRYNGMLLGTRDLLAETRRQALTVAAAIEAQRDFWVADTDLHVAVTSASPSALAALDSPTAASADTTAGH